MIAVVYLLGIIADRIDHHTLIVDLIIQDHLHVDLYIHIIIIHIDHLATVVIAIAGTITMAIAGAGNK
jgi:hypothetical protein